MAYATPDHVYAFLSAQAFVVLPRPIENIATDFNPTTGVIRLRGHGLSTSDLVYLIAVSGGSIPGGASALTYYSPLPLGGDLFKLAATPNGSPMTFSSAGAGWSVAVDPERRLGIHLEDAYARLNACLTAHAPPLKPDPVTAKYHPEAVGLNARMAARSAVTSLQIENAAYRKAVDRLFAQEAADNARLEELKRGMPLNPRPVDQDSIPDNSARARGCAPIPWQRKTL